MKKSVAKYFNLFISLVKIVYNACCEAFEVFICYFEIFMGVTAAYNKFLLKTLFDIIFDTLEDIADSKLWNDFVMVISNTLIHYFNEIKRGGALFLIYLDWFVKKSVNLIEHCLAVYGKAFYLATFICVFILANLCGKISYGPEFSTFDAAIEDFSWILKFLVNVVLLNGASLLFITPAMLFIGFFLVPKFYYVLKLSPREVAMGFSTCIFAFIMVSLLIYDYDLTFENISELFVGEQIYDLYPRFYFVCDPLSLALAALISFIFPVAIMAGWEKVVFKSNFYYFNVIVLEIFVLCAVFTLDLFLFLIFFEALFIPMVFIILIGGSRQRKIKATSYILLYTLLGSAFFLTGVLYIYSVFGSTNYFFILNNLDKLTWNDTLFLWIAFFVPFAIKIPMFPFHLWLLEAHVEAPTSGSIILAAVLLKLGGYGFIRFLIPLFPEASLFFSPLVIVLALISILYASFAACRQTDIKKIIAYSSVAHMNLIVLGIFSFNMDALYGSIILMLGHGIVSSALFFLAGILYDRYHTRSVSYYGGLSQVMPVFSVFLFYFTTANFGFPWSVSFIGEFFIFLGVTKELGVLVSLILGFASIFMVYLNMVLFISICFGPINNAVNNNYQDLNFRELKILLSLSSASFLLFIFHAEYAALLSSSAVLHFHMFV